jgi:glycosyltransferase involved in cell wall biosynthesis
LGISEAVTFHGHVDDVTKHAVVQRCWVHVLPSAKEGWGLAVIEAAQHGVPTIGYRSSGGLNDSVVDGVTGLLVDDHDELVRRLEQLLGDAVLRSELGAKAAARSQEFSWPQSAAAMSSVLETVHTGGRVSGVI